MNKTELEKFCDEYCKYKPEYKDPDDLFRERCDRCPILEEEEVSD